MIDSGLKMMAWHNHLPSRVLTHIQSWILTFLLFFFLFLIRSCMCVLQRSHLYPFELHSVLMIMIMMIKLMINDC